jgi:hypothetical protein
MALSNRHCNRRVIVAFALPTLLLMTLPLLRLQEARREGRSAPSGIPGNAIDLGVVRTPGAMGRGDAPALEFLEEASHLRSRDTVTLVWREDSHDAQQRLGCILARKLEYDAPTRTVREYEGKYEGSGGVRYLEYTGVTAQRLARAQAMARAQSREPHLTDLLRVGCRGRLRGGRVRPAT